MLINSFAASKIGPTARLTLPAAGSNTQSNLYAIATTLYNSSRSRPIKFPILWVVRVSVEAYLTQAAIGATIDVNNVRSLPLLTNVYWPLSIESPEDSLVGYEAVGATPGTIHFTIVNYSGSGYTTSNIT